MYGKPMLSALIAGTILSCMAAPAYAEGHPSDATASAPADDGARLSDATAAKIDTIAKSWVQGGKAPGVAIGIAMNGKVLFDRGYGYANLDDRVPVTEATIFRAGSIQKQFTAAAVLLLAERGKLSLDDPLAKYFPEIPQADKVTVRHLLSHTSGIHDAFGDEFDPQIQRKLRLDLSHEELLKIIGSSNPAYDFQPGAGFHYSNTGYILAGMIVEKVSGQDIREFLQQNIFSKLGMTDTAIDNDKDVVPHRAQGYDAVPDKPGAFQHAGFVSMGAFQWSGALRTTVHDLATWQHALLSGQVIGPKLLEEMTSSARLNDGRRTSEGVWPAGKRERGDYGFGLYLLEFGGRKLIVHGGSVNGFEAVAGTFADGFSFVVLTNSSSGLSSGGEDIWLQVIQAMLQENEVVKS